MEYTIIGGGLSGLYAGYLLVKRGITNICIIEKNEHLGGRIHTLHLDDNVTIELGAGGIMNTHKPYLELVNELGLTVKLSDGSSGRS